MAKGFIQQQENSETQNYFGKSAPPKQVITQKTDDNVIASKPVYVAKKDISLANRSADVEANDANTLLKLIQENRVKYLQKFEQTPGIIDNSKEFRLAYTVDSLKLTFAALQRNIHVESVGSAITPYAVMALANKDVSSKIPITIYDKLEPLARKYKVANEEYGAFYDRCAGGELPYCPDTIALLEVGLMMKFYKDFRNADKADRKDVEKKYRADYDKLTQFAKDDNISRSDWTDRNHIIVANLVKTDIVCKRMFSFVYDYHAVDFSTMEHSFASSVDALGKVHTSSIYRMPMGGLEYKDGGSFNYRFGPRMPYTHNVYDDMLYETMRKHYGPAHRAYSSDKPEDKLYLKNSLYMKDIQFAYEIRSLMMDDKYSKEEIDNILQAAQKRCEMYYHTEVPEGIEEWLNEHPEDAHKFEKATPVKAKKHIKIEKFDSLEEVGGWIVKPSDAEYESTVICQAKYMFPQDFNFAKTLMENDYKNIAQMMNDLAYSIDPGQTTYIEENTINMLQKSAIRTFNEFLDKYFNVEMNESQRKAYDLLTVIPLTDAPVFDSEFRIVATRGIPGVVEIGDEGGRLKGNSTLAPGCWIYTKSSITDTDVTGCVGIFMRSDIKNSVIDGNGVIANTEIKNCHLTGAFNEKENRLALGSEHKSPVHTLKIANLDKDFGDDEAKTKCESRMFTHANEYKDRTVEDYVVVWQSKNHARNVLKKMGNKAANAESKTAEATTVKTSSKNL